jgi:hypothetical protein
LFRLLNATRIKVTNKWSGHKYRRIPGNLLVKMSGELHAPATLFQRHTANKNRVRICVVSKTGLHYMVWMAKKNVAPTGIQSPDLPAP